MKRIIALDTVRKTKTALKVRDGKLLLEPALGGERHNYVITPAHHDSHTHPMLYSLFFGALKPVMLNESTSKMEILGKLMERASQTHGPIVAYEYKVNAGITAHDLVEFRNPVLLVDSSMHSGVANGPLLAEMMRRKKGHLRGDCSPEGISEEYNFLALAIMEDHVKERGVEEAVKWVKARGRDGTTSMDEKIILTETEWEIFKEAAKRLKDELGYMPVKSVYIVHDLFVQDPGKYALEGESLGVKVGVKWVGDGGLGSKTAALGEWFYTDGSKGHLTMPFERENDPRLDDYIRLLRDNGITDLACHAIGDRAIDTILGLVDKFRRGGIAVAIEHFELPKNGQLYTAATKNVPLNMQLNYSTEVWRYAPWLGQVKEFINPVRRILDIYKRHSSQELITFGTDGMPQSMLWAIACGVNHPIRKESITLGEAIEHSKDPEHMIVMRREVYGALSSLKLKSAAENRELGAARFNRAVEAVFRTEDRKILYIR